MRSRGEAVLLQLIGGKYALLREFVDLRGILPAAARGEVIPPTPRLRCTSWAVAARGGRRLFHLHHSRLLAGLSRGLSGGDILNISMNAIHAGSVDADSAKWRITQGMLETEIEKVRVAKVEHSGKAKRGRRRVIGFGG